MLVAGAIIGIILVAIVFLILVNQDPDAIAGSTDVPSPPTSLAASASPTRPAATGAEPTPEPSASPEASTPMPSPSVDQATALGLPPGLLPAGSVVLATADGIRIRESPSTRAGIVATASAGDAVYIESAISAGPVSADGYDWYQVAYAGGADIWPWQDVIPREATMHATGWMAAGSATERFVRLPEVMCPSEPISLSILASELTDWERLVCLRDSPFTIEGTYGCDGCGGVTPGAEPVWLADALIGHVPIGGAFMYYPFVHVASQPGTPVPQDRDIVRATLHVDDPAAVTCTYTPDPQGTTPTLTYDPIAVQTYCRERLVLESFEVIGHEDVSGGWSPPQEVAAVARSEPGRGERGREG